ncbi:hypothetical protein MASR2M48_13070 [Spirochaetota bacterium]
MEDDALIGDILSLGLEVYDPYANLANKTRRATDYFIVVEYALARQVRVLGF